ncbi:IS5 family transposase [Thiocystis violacea]|uniref:IS5 family transposase n=1 Tax=Thiocystis violacea TaxID=13725 RepID=UPI001906FF69|nr:IS5 family transposase [Thiocystis violacea]MBK1718948.1 IS5/IS1182 family transposase [Thiocystis violacea]
MSSTDPGSGVDVSPKKATYRVTNWSEYDRALVARGDITFWFDPAAITQRWTPAPTGKRGAPWRYSDWSIQTLLVLKQVFHLPYRSLEGFGRSLMRLMGLDWPIPDHTHLSRRVRALVVQIPRQERTGPIHVVVDSTGLKVFGEGEWKVRQHGAGKRRTWLKVHLAVDAHAKDVIGVEVTTPAWTDGEVFRELVDQVDGVIEQIEADGAYDTHEAYDVAAQHQAKLVVPPRDNAVAWDAEHPRTQALAEIQEKGLAPWKKDTGYHHRSLAENAMYRLKQLFGAGVASRLFDAQVNEVHARIAAMNRMTYLGMPVSVRVGVTAS